MEVEILGIKLYTLSTLRLRTMYVKKLYIRKTNTEIFKNNSEMEFVPKAAKINFINWKT